MFKKSNVEDMIDMLSESLDKHSLTEVEYKKGNMVLRISKNGSSMAAPMVAAPVQASVAKPVEVKEETVDLSNAEKSPMVGVVYLKPDPDSPDYAPVGATVKAGDTLCLVEAMKTYNPVKASKSGTIKKVLVKTGASVEFDEPLFIIE